MVEHHQDFLAFAIEVLEKILNESSAAIEQSAEAIAEAIENEKLLYLYGSGHSALVAQDGAGRAGGLVPAVLIEDAAHGDAERLEGMAAIIAGRFVLIEGSVLIIISNSGINAVPIEMATIGKEKGLTTVAITSLEHSKGVDSRHSSGKKLFEVADIVIDTHSVRGDAALEVKGSEYRTGATSTMAGCAIIQAITAQTVALLAEKGHTPPILVSANVPEGRDHDYYAMLEHYRKYLARYQLPIR